MPDYLLEQNADGVWRATSTDENDRITNVGGWDALADLLRENTVHWDSPSSLSRFRGQFGEPPPTMDLHRLTVTGVGGSPEVERPRVVDAPDPSADEEASAEDAQA